jgi:hypothetical protein
MKLQSFGPQQRTRLITGIRKATLENKEIAVAHGAR